MRLFRLMSRLAFVPLAAVACHHASDSSVKVTNGKVENNFPYVVQIIMDGAGSCTGSFVSDSLLLTAAHCVQRASTVKYGTTEVGRKSMFIHPMWPSKSENCNLPTNPKYDVALVRFPSGTYTGPEFAKLSPRAPDSGETFKIVGFGNNLIEPFDTFCKLPSQKNAEGLCAVQMGQKTSGATYSFSEIFTFEPAAPVQGIGCPADCTRDALKLSLQESGQDFTSFVADQCDGNFRDRPYKESGVGTRRSGENVVGQVSDGTIIFHGALGGTPSGVESASGAGDSGGPLFIKVDGDWKIAGVTHGGMLTEKDDELKKRSIYVDLNANHNRNWLKEVAEKESLVFPGL